MNLIDKTLNALSFGPTFGKASGLYSDSTGVHISRHRNLAMVALFDGSKPAPRAAETIPSLSTLLSGQSRTRRDAPDYLTLDQVLGIGMAQVKEVTDTAGTSTLVFENRAPRKVLLLEGDELPGTRVSRTLNSSILVGKGHTVQIPFSRLARTPWRDISREFTSIDSARFDQARAKVAAALQRDMRTNVTESAEGDGDVALAERVVPAIRESAARTSAGSSLAVIDPRRGVLIDYVRAITAEEGQVGAVFLIDGEPVGLELFDASSTLHRRLERLVASYAMRAFSAAADSQFERAITLDGVRAFLEGVKAARVIRSNGAGLGQDLRIVGTTIRGGALVAGTRVVRLGVGASS